MQYHCPTSVRATEPDFPIKCNELSRYRGQEVESLIFRRGVHCVHERPARTDMLARADFVDKQALDDPFRIAPQSNRLAIRYGHDGAASPTGDPRRQSPGLRPAPTHPRRCASKALAQC